MSEENKFLEDDLAILAEFVDESEADLNTVDRLFVELEARPEDIDLINTIFRPMHSIKGNSAFLGLMNTRRLAHEIENLLDDLRKKNLKSTPEIISALLAGVDEIKAMLEHIRNRENEIADEKKFNQLILSIQKARSGEIADQKPVAIPPVKHSTPTPKKPSSANTVMERTIRIPERHLDEFEKIIVCLTSLAESLLKTSDKTNKTSSDLTETLSSIIKNFQEQLDSLRSVPASELLQRAPRIARETATALGKTARVELIGETTRLPRSLAGTLETPLMHMVRNAVDHGLEEPDIRSRAGKTPEGHIRIEMKEEQGQFIMTVADDGPGIDFKTLLTKAIAKGIINRDRKLTPEDIMNLIFLPGISSAKKVTDISGRGVGMDVVKNMIESAGGSIQARSKPGAGTEFIICFQR